MLFRAVGLILIIAAGCEKVSRHRVPDARPAPPPPPVDAAPPRVDAAPAPPDAAPPPPDAAPPPPSPRPGRRDACETDDDCTTYGDPCGGGIFPVAKRHKDRALAVAQRKCPHENMAYLTTLDATRTRCVRNRCRMANELELGPGAE
jgi:hypothetical protein